MDITRKQFTDDPHRPIFHFLPPKNWMNDPNGMIQWRGRYHLFYQHNPSLPVWGDIHWGHAVSDDFIHWQDMPIALAPTPNSYDEKGIWSGCAVDNDGMATILYTGASGDRHQTQTVCMAISTDDDLATWHKYEQNPLISTPPDEFAGCGFRDPYVWREGTTWYMVIGAGQKGGSEAVLLYQSPDLYQWQYLHPLYVSTSENDYAYECPNFFQLGNKWVLLVSVMPESHTEYIIGTYANHTFTPEHHGKLVDGDFYAPLTFADDRGRRLMLGWIKETSPVSHWQKAGWAGCMSLPVELTLSEDERWLLHQPLVDLIPEHRHGQYWAFDRVTDDQLAEIDAQIGTKAIKVILPDSPDFTLYIDHSVIEAFGNYGFHKVMRSYEETGIRALKHFFYLPPPGQRVHIWPVDSIWQA